MSKWVYSFGAGHNEGGANMKNLLGGKGANLAEMASIGLPVPPGFTLTTEVCTAFYTNRQQYPAGLQQEVECRAGTSGKGGGTQVRRSEESAARVGALRRPCVDAGHDGHGAEPRPERRYRGGPHRCVA